jgi:hypothetical protein
LDSSEQKMQKAVEILRRAADTIEARGVERDQADGERTMESTVAAFNLLTGHQLTETQGWLFMALLKMRRALYGRFQPDDFLDGAAYFALAGEAAEAVEQLARRVAPANEGNGDVIESIAHHPV